MSRISVFKMPERELYLLVEGNDDKRLFDQKIKPILEQEYPSVRIWKFKELRPADFQRLMNTIREKEADYLVITDFDRATCVTMKKESVSLSYAGVSASNIALVIQVIEGWYIAGLDGLGRRKHQIPETLDSNAITKASFNSIYGTRTSAKAAKVRMLSDFTIQVAVSNNQSFEHFHRNYILPIQSRG
jgi:hypothetical protein